MANPVIIDIPKNVITKVATDINFGIIIRLDTNSNYRQTYRSTGEPAPTDVNEFAPIFVNYDYAEINSDTDLDIYMINQYADGKVRIDQ